MTYQAGSASVSITPDFKDFHSQIREELTGLDEQFASAGDKAGKSFSDSFSTQLRASFADLPNATVKADADTAELDAKLDESVRERTAEVIADADTAPAEAKLDELAKKKRTAKIDVQEVLQKGGTLSDLLNPVGLGAAAGLALGPQAAGLAAGLAGLGVSFAAAGAEAAAFGSIAKPMFADVATAQKALTKAQDEYNKAATPADRAKALQAEQQALAKLTPAERDLLTQVTALEGAWKKLSQAEQPVVESALTPWLQTATSGMQLLRPLIEDGATAVGRLGTEAKSALGDPFWGTFFSTLGGTGQVALVNFGEAAGHVADGLAHLFVTFAPDIDKLPPLVNDVARSFDNWSKSVTSKGLDDFLTKTFTPANVSALAADGKDLATFVENVARASADMSPLAFLGLSNVLSVLGSVPPGVIEAATALFLAAKTIGSISSGVNAISSVIGGIKGLLGGAATDAEAAAEGTAAGTAAGTSAATAFTATFGTEVTAALAGVFTEVGATGSAEAGTAGTAWGTAAATAFGASMGAEDAIDVTAALAGLGAAGSAEAAAAGAAMGTAAAGGFTAAFDSEGAAEIGASIGAASIGAAIAAGIAGAAIGGALGLGFNLGLAASGVSGAAGKIKDETVSAASGANTWLQPAGQQAADGFGTGFLSQAGRVQGDVAQVRGWTQAGASGAGGWIQPHGQQAATGFGTGFLSEHARINSNAAQIRAWVSEALPAPASWLVNAGVSVVQGFANGITSAAGTVISAAQSIANSVTNIIKSALSIGSPSKVTDQLGRFTGQGFGGGLLSQVPFVEQSAGQLAMASVHGLASAASAQSLAALGSLGVPSVPGGGSLPGVTSPLRTGPLQLQLSYAGTGNQLTDALVGALRADIQGLAGGDVQAHLGLGPVRLPTS